MRHPRNPTIPPHQASAGPAAHRPTTAKCNIEGMLEHEHGPLEYGRALDRTRGHGPSRALVEPSRVELDASAADGASGAVPGATLPEPLLHAVRVEVVVHAGVAAAPHGLPYMLLSPAHPPYRPV